MVNVIATQVGVAVGRFNFDHAFAHFQYENVKRSAAKVVDRDRLVLFLVEAVGQGRRRRLINNARNFKAGDFSGLLGGLALAVVKIGGDSDHRFGDFFTKKIFRRSLQLLKNHRGDFLRGVRLAHNFDARVVVRPLDYFVRDTLRFLADFIVPAPHEPLYGVNRVFRVRNRLALGHLPYQTLSALGETNHRGRGSSAFLVRDDGRFAALHHRYHGVGGAEVNTYTLAHKIRSCDVRLFLAELSA